MTDRSGDIKDLTEGVIKDLTEGVYVVKVTTGRRGRGRDCRFCMDVDVPFRS